MKGVFEHPARGPDERMALLVLLVARDLADEHHRDVRWSLTEHHLRGVLVQRARHAASRIGPEPGDLVDAVVGLVPSCSHSATAPVSLLVDLDDELVSLVSVHDRPPDRQRLASPSAASCSSSFGAPRQSVVTATASAAPRRGATT